MRWNRTLVTGASPGIGRAIARQLAADGTRLVIVACDRERFEAPANELDVDCEVLVADLSDRGAPANVEARLRDESPIDLVVNNAGFGQTGTLHELDAPRETPAIDVNAVALHRLSRVAAEVLVERGGSGGILNVSSVAAFAPRPNSAATKAVAAAGLRAIDQNHDVVVPGGLNKVGADILNAPRGQALRFLSPRVLS